MQIRLTILGDTQVGSVGQPLPNYSNSLSLPQVGRNNALFISSCRALFTLDR